MSLTGRLRQRWDPLRVFFEDRLPDLSVMRERWREHGVVRIAPPDDVDRGYLGAAFGYRFAYLFAKTPLERTAASLGPQYLAASGPAPTGWDVAFANLADTLGEFLSRNPPVGRLLGEAAERRLCALCYLLALYEAPRRSPYAALHSPLRELPGDAGIDAQLALVGGAAVDDLVALTKTARDAGVLDLTGGRATCGPLFAGSPEVGGADADVIADGLLVEVKTTTEARLRKREWAYQLIGYALLDYDNRYRIDRVAFYLSRAGVLLSWRLEDLLASMADEPVTVEDLRTEMRQILTST